METASPPSSLGLSYTVYPVTRRRTARGRQAPSRPRPSSAGLPQHGPRPACSSEHAGTPSGRLAGHAQTLPSALALSSRPPCRFLPFWGFGKSQACLHPCLPLQDNSALPPPFLLSKGQLGYSFHGGQGSQPQRCHDGLAGHTNGSRRPGWKAAHCSPRPRSASKALEKFVAAKDSGMALRPQAEASRTEIPASARSLFLWLLRMDGVGQG